MRRRPLTEDLWLPEHETAQTVQVGHSPLPFDESDCHLPVRFAEIRAPMRSERSIETMMVPRRALADSAPTVLLKAATEDPPEPSETFEELVVPPPPRSSSWMMFVLVLLAISLASITLGVLIAPIVD